jgi:uncharacterized alpha-E superfamily protein
MLSRTADSLFWLARYMERAESIARLLLVGHRMASLSRSLGGEGNEWQSALVTSGCEPGYVARHGEVTPEAVIDYLVRDRDNPSSIVSCLETARRNARAVRTALTADMWEVINDTWRETRAISHADLGHDALVPRLEWIKQRSLLFSGAYLNTMLRNEAFCFTHLGTMLERADNTARILDVKYHVLLSGPDRVGGALDHAQWQSILHAVTALRAYHWVYHDRLKPRLVGELMILRAEMPRSLASCSAQSWDMLERIAAANDGARGDCHRRAEAMHRRLGASSIDEIFDGGLHEFLTEFADHTIALGREIGQFYLHP